MVMKGMSPCLAHAGDQLVEYLDLLMSNLAAAVELASHSAGSAWHLKMTAELSQAQAKMLQLLSSLSVLQTSDGGRCALQPTFG